MKGILWRTAYWPLTIIALICSMMSLNRKYKEQLKLFYLVLGNNHLKQIMYNPENGFL
jgi:hypothetical protein